MIYRAFPLFGSGNFIGQAFVEAPPEPLYQVERFTDVLYEASWFGPNQERRESFIESLE